MRSKRKRKKVSKRELSKIIKNIDGEIKRRNNVNHKNHIKIMNVIVGIPSEEL